MRTGSPMSSQNTSPPSPICAAFITSDAASSPVMKKRVASGSVSGTGRPRSTQRSMISTTLPLLPRMLPKRVTMVLKRGVERSSVTSSANRLLAPITLRDSAALSDEMKTKRAPTSRAALSACTVPSTLVRAAATTERSASVTCL